MATDFLVPLVAEAHAKQLYIDTLRENIRLARQGNRTQMGMLSEEEIQCLEAILEAIEGGNDGKR